MLCSQKPLLHILDLTLIVNENHQLLRRAITIQNSPICCKESIFKCLLEVFVFECFLLCQNFVYVLASEQCNFITTVAIIDAKKAKSVIYTGGFEFCVCIFCLQI